MMVFLKKLLIFLVCTGGLAYGLSFALPSSWEVAREMQVGTHSGLVHDCTNDLSTWDTWSPWGSAANPGVKLTPSPQGTGTGATLAWEGKKVAHGKATITASDDDKGLWFDVELRGGREKLEGVLTYDNLPNGTTMVKFSLSGDVEHDPVGRYLGLLRNYTTGPEIVDALTRLKRLVEGRL